MLTLSVEHSHCGSTRPESFRMAFVPQALILVPVMANQSNLIGQARDDLPENLYEVRCGREDRNLQYYPNCPHLRPKNVHHKEYL